METVQEKLDALIAEHGAGKVLAAAKAHVHPDSGGDCKTTGCPIHYICNPSTGNCQLDIGSIVAQ